MSGLLIMYIGILIITGALLAFMIINIIYSIQKSRVKRMVRADYTGK